MAVLESRIGHLLDKENPPLRRHQDIVAEALSDFKAKVPDQPPLPASALLVFVDGRQHGSQYPNFMLDSERQTFGL